MGADRLIASPDRMAAAGRQENVRSSETGSEKRPLGAKWLMSDFDPLRTLGRADSLRPISGTLGRLVMKIWYYVCLVPWAAFMLFGVLAILDFGFETLVPVVTGVGFWIEIAFKALLILFPLWAFPFAMKRKHT